MQRRRFSEDGSKAKDFSTPVRHLPGAPVEARD